MSLFDKAREKAEDFMGDAKEKLGQQKDDADNQDQMSGEGQEQGNGLRDEAQDAVEGTKERFGQ